MPEFPVTHNAYGRLPPYPNSTIPSVNAARYGQVVISAVIESLRKSNANILSSTEREVGVCLNGTWFLCRVGAGKSHSSGNTGRLGEHLPSELQLLPQITRNPDVI